MLLFQGSIHSPEYTQECIDTLHTLIPHVLSKPALDVEVVLHAAQRLFDKVTSGALDEALSTYINFEEFDTLDLQTVMQRFRYDALKARVKKELGHIDAYQNVKIEPKGVILHIAAGNLDVLPAYSVLEGLLTGNINLLKLPSGDHGFTVFILHELVKLCPELRDYIAVFDTPSSDLETIQKLMTLSHAIVIWGSDDTIASVRTHAPINTEIIEWGHKLSFCYIHDPHIEYESLTQLAHHILSTNQRFCNSCQGVFVDTHDFNQVQLVGKRLAACMAEIEDVYPLPLFLQAKFTVNKRAKKLEALHKKDTSFWNQRSSVSCLQDHELMLSDMNGNIWVKPLPYDKITQTLYKHKTHLQTVALMPFDKAVMTPLMRAGCTTITSIDHMSMMAIGDTHDGRLALPQLVRLVEINE